MGTSESAVAVANSFERCERLCRSAREAVERTRRMRSEAAEMRLRAQQTRAELRRRLLPERRDDAPPAPADVVQLTALISFVRARLDEEAAAADLFHEFGCPASGTGGTYGCACRAPHRAHQDIATRRHIARVSEAAIREADHAAPHWPFTELNALLDLKALAFAYEVHWLWQEEWRP
ncbi:hypothetical protein [Streptomyces flavofungini]|uniref:hypothetical protein n=1 Tax=Streptomyces flavofungini TaxID=68200 RepID=UPI0034DFA1DD